MTKNASGPNVASLFQAATTDGNLTNAAAMVVAVPDMGAQIQAGLGIAADDVTASEVFLVTLLIDDSGSIRFVRGNTEAVRDGHNGVLDALRGSKQKDGILAHTSYLNGRVLYPYTPIENAVRMDTANYDPNGGTPLFDQTVVTLATVLAKAQEFADNGVPCRTATLIVTDGADAGSYKQSSSSVRKVVESMLKNEMHIIAGMGVSDGSTDFGDVFRSMGIPDGWVLTAGNTPQEIRRAFRVFSQSAVRASQGAKAFSAAAGGGFGSP